MKFNKSKCDAWQSSPMQKEGLKDREELCGKDRGGPGGQQQVELL